MTAEFLHMETPDAPRPDGSTGELLTEAAWCAGAAVVLVAVAVVMEVGDLVRVWNEYRRGCA